MNIIKSYPAEYQGMRYFGLDQTFFVWILVPKTLSKTPFVLCFFTLGHKI